MANPMIFSVLLRALPALLLSLAVLRLSWLWLVCKSLLRLLGTGGKLIVTWGVAFGVFELFAWWQRNWDADKRHRIAFHRRFVQRYHTTDSAKRAPAHRCFALGGGGAVGAVGAVGAAGAGANTSLVHSGFRLKYLTRIPLETHLHTCWRLPQVICHEVATFVHRFVQENITNWFDQVSSDPEFPQTIGFLLGNCAAAFLAKTTTELDVGHAIQLATNCVELVRLHFAWFRELFAQLSEEFPECFDDGVDTTNSLQQPPPPAAPATAPAATAAPAAPSPQSSLSHPEELQHPSTPNNNDDDVQARERLLLHRQRLMALYAQQSRFLHPACVLDTLTATEKDSESPGADSTTTTTTTTQRPPRTPQEMKYLRHMATQLLLQLSPAFQDHETNLFSSMGMAFAREQLVAKCFSQLLGYTEQRDANQLIIQLLQGIDDLDDANMQSLPVQDTSMAPEPVPLQRGSTSSPSSPRDSLKSNERPGPQPMADPLSRRNSIVSKLNATSFHYKATRRLETVDVAVAALGLDEVGGVVPVEDDDEEEDEQDDYDAEDDQQDEPYPTRGQRSPCNSNHDLKPSLHMLQRHNPMPIDTCLSPPPRDLETDPNKFKLPTKSRPKSTTEGKESERMPLDELRNMKVNLETSLNDSLVKLRNKFKKNPTPSSTDLSGSTPPTSPATMSSVRSRNSPLGAEISISEPFPAPIHPLSPAHRLVNRFKMKKKVAVEPVGLSLCPTAHDLPSSSTAGGATTTRTPSLVVDPLVWMAPAERLQDKLVGSLDKAVTNYLKMYHEQPEMRSSSRCRELHELLASLEDIFVLGLRTSASRGSEQSPSRPWGSPTTTSNTSSKSKCRGSMTGFTTDDLDYRRGQVPTAVVSVDEDGNVGSYWRYLAQPRAETPFFDELVALVTRQLPLCQESDFFYCTRGIQWMLLALQKGSLWENVTALKLNHHVTESFYDDIAVLRNENSMQKVLQVLFRLNDIRVQLTIPPVRTIQDSAHQPPPQDDQDLVTSPRVVVEVVWEMELYLPLHGWTRTADKKFNDLPSSEWIWESDWRLEKENTDNTEDGASSVDTSTNSSSSGWEFARSAFDDKFHDKEKRFDSIRRRKWMRSRRQLTPVLVLPPTSECNGVIHSSTPVGRAMEEVASSATTPITSPRDGSLPVKSRRRESRLIRTRSTDIRAIVAEYEQQAAAAATAGIAVDNSCLRDRRSSDPPGIGPRGAVNVESPAPGLGEGSNCCFRCLKPMQTTSSHGSGSTRPSRNQCLHCRQIVCWPCHQFFVFLVYPPPKDKGKKEQVCVSCYQRLVARYKIQLQVQVIVVGCSGGTNTSLSSTNLLSDAGGAGGAGGATGATGGGGGGGGSENYEILLQSVATGYQWSVFKTFGEVEALEKKLLEKKRKQEKKRLGHWKGVDFMEFSGCLSGADSSEFDKRLVHIESLLRGIVASDSLCRSAPVQKFLLLGEKQRKGSLEKAPPKKPTLRLGLGFTGGPHQTTRDREDHSGLLGSMDKTKNPPKWQANARKWLNLDGQKTAKLRVLQKLELCLFSFLNEIFEFDGFGVVRRNLFVMVRRVLKAALSVSHFGLLEQKYRHMLDPNTIVTGLERFRAWMFPSEAELKRWMMAQLEQEQANHKIPISDLRKQSLDAIAKHLPPALVALFGENACENASLKLHEFCQHQLFLKNLLFSICDELCCQLYSDFVVFKSKEEEQEQVDEAHMRNTNSNKTSGSTTSCSNKVINNNNSSSTNSTSSSSVNPNKRRHSHGLIRPPSPLAISR